MVKYFSLKGTCFHNLQPLCLHLHVQCSLDRESRTRDLLHMATPPALTLTQISQSSSSVMSAYIKDSPYIVVCEIYKK
jgi:hypothetical protein